MRGPQPPQGPSRPQRPWDDRAHAAAGPGCRRCAPCSPGCGRAPSRNRNGLGTQVPRPFLVPQLPCGKHGVKKGL